MSKHDETINGIIYDLRVIGKSKETEPSVRDLLLRAANMIAELDNAVDALVEDRDNLYDELKKKDNEMKNNSIYEDDMAFGNHNNNLLNRLYALASSLGGDDGATINEAIAELEGNGFDVDDPCEPNDNNSPAWEDRDAASDQAAQDALDIERDWQNAALIAQEEADYLRGVLAAREEQIDQMQQQINDLKRSVLFLANNASLIKGTHDAARNTDRQLLVERRARESCMARRQANENNWDGEEGN